MGSSDDTTDGEPSLLNLSARFCITNLPDTLTYNMELRPGIVLPVDVCEKLLEVSDKTSDEFDKTIVPLFKDPTITRLKTLHLRHSKLNDTSFSILLKHEPFEIDIHGCGTLTKDSLENINQNNSHLQSLIIGNSSQILPPGLMTDVTTIQSSSHIVKRGYILDTPKLKKFVLWGLHTEESLFWKILLNYSNLTYLDFSNCMFIGELNFLQGAPNLRYLSLFNVQLNESGFEIIKTLSLIRHLDISRSHENNTFVYDNPNDILTSLVINMPYLKSLDIGGTNLAGRGIGSERHCDIQGLNSRVGNPLDFLGLYNTHHDASHRHHIPAKLIAGDKDELQILTACQAYMDRHEVLEKVLNDLFHLFRAEKGSNIKLSLNLILQAMERHIIFKHVQISGSASLFYIVKYYESKENISTTIRKNILSSLIHAMDVHKFDPTMMRNGCLTICLFKIPADVMFTYEKLVTLLLEILANGIQVPQEDFVERVAIYLLNSLACQVEGQHKKLVGDLGAIQRMLLLIQERLSKNECDDVMEIAWSTMWNVTDETAENCEKFLNGNGMGLFLNCLNTFPNKPELLRNMMGLLGNVAEVQALRPQLMTTDFIHVFYTLLDSTQDNIEVSYNAAGVLAHILSDGTDAWKIEQPTRELVLENMTRNIQRWEINSQRNINYRSFEPILRLLTIQHTSVCQMWAAWALANLTKVYPLKYCPLLEKEGGIILLSQLLNLNTIVSRYAALSINHVKEFKETGNNVPPVLDG